MFLLWYLIIYNEVKGADGIVEFIKLALMSLGVHTVMAAQPEPPKQDSPPQSNSQSGRSMISFLALLAGACLLILAACSTTQSAQQHYVQSCAAYNAALSTAVELRIAGKLTQSEIDSITLIDNQATPICTGQLPADPVAAARQVTAAITTLTILEATKKAGAK
jgi:hypothetical protein